MDFKELFKFLETLQKNNSKDWMDENRDWYHKVRDNYKEWLAETDLMLAEIDTEYYPTSPGKALNRINNNLLYHPNKPTYKDHFGAGLDKKPKTSDFYIHLGVEECFLAGGFWRPKSEFLKSIRQAIDYNGEVLNQIIHEENFQKHFGGLMKDERLTNAPKGFTQEHPHIDLLKKKSFVAHQPISRKQVLSPNFQNTIKATYLAMLDFRRYLNKAVTV